MDIGVATTTFYRSQDDWRFELALKTLDALRELEIPVIVVDGSPDRTIKERMRQVGAMVVDEVPGSSMGGSRRQVLRMAGEEAGYDVVVWMEPEKYPLVPFVDKMCAPVLSGEADIVVPRRTDKLASYPVVQRLAEQCGNAVFESVCGRSLDVWFGPRVMNEEALSYFLDYDGSYGDEWHVLFMPLLSAIKNGLSVIEVGVDCIHPFEQTSAESEDPYFLMKRLQQLHELGNALIKQARSLEMLTFF